MAIVTFFYIFGFGWLKMCPLLHFWFGLLQNVAIVTFVTFWFCLLQNVAIVFVTFLVLVGYKYGHCYICYISGFSWLQIWPLLHLLHFWF